MRTLTVGLLVSAILASGPSLAAAQAGDPLLVPVAPTVPAYGGVGLSDGERQRLLDRTGEELELEPLPADPTGIALELELVRDQRDAIDISGITALQVFGVIFMVTGAVVGLLGVLVGALVLAFGGEDGFLIGSAAIGLPLLGVGALMLGLAELDGNLHRRRELDARIRRLREAQRYEASPYLTLGGGGLMVRGTF